MEYRRKAAAQRRMQWDRHGRRKRPGRYRLWLLAAGGCAALPAVAVLLTSPAPERVVHAASEIGCLASSASGSGGWAGGPGGPMTGGSGPTGGSGSAGAGSGSDGSGGWAGSGGPGSGEWDGSGGSAGGPVSGNSANRQRRDEPELGGLRRGGHAGHVHERVLLLDGAAVTCTAQQTFSSFWVGLDGDGTRTVEQTGTEADCTNGAPATRAGSRCSPTPRCSTTSLSPRRRDERLGRRERRRHVHPDAHRRDAGLDADHEPDRAPAQLGSAEVIAEAPSDAATVLPLSSFGTVNFTSAPVDNAALANANAGRADHGHRRRGHRGHALSAANGDSFSVTWDSNGTAGRPGGRHGGHRLTRPHRGSHQYQSHGQPYG